MPKNASQSASLVWETSLPESAGVKLFSRGKVRDVYEHRSDPAFAAGRRDSKTADYLLIVTTDRLSAFDVVLPDPIPCKGAVLTALSEFWFGLIKDITPTHFVTANFKEITNKIPVLAGYENELKGRSMLVKKVRVFPVECIVRGYLAGSGWSEYSKQGTICGIKLPSGMKESERLKEPIFTPSTKAISGHDENISFEKTVELIGKKDAEELRSRTLKIYENAHRYALGKGIIICDTKMEWGRDEKGNIILADELLTPDSSRFWPADSYQPGKGQPSFDKQFVRDYLISIGWDKKPPAPKLPDEIIKKTSEKYLEAYKRLTGKAL
ncbi:MAG: phosphoribosylaminoimidazolesuccinocarboxamide synthase [Planctomycetota bacterium]